MRTFKEKIEAIAQNKGSKMKLPPELSDAYVMDKTGWNIFIIRATPPPVLERLMFYWHIQDMAAKADERIAKREASRN